MFLNKEVFIFKNKTESRTICLKQVEPKKKWCYRVGEQLGLSIGFSTIFLGRISRNSVWVSVSGCQIKVQLPSNLQYLTFGDRFNQSLVYVQLPANLQSLTFGYEFSSSLEDVTLPQNLRILTFGGRYNQSFERVVLPEMLEELTFGEDFNQNLKHVKLPSLRSLTLGWWVQTVAYFFLTPQKSKMMVTVIFQCSQSIVWLLKNY